MCQVNRGNASRSARAVAAVLTIVGCGGGGSTGPGSNLDLTGGWLYETLLIGQGWQCVVPLVNLQLTQSGTTVTGTYSDNGFACLGPSGASVFPNLGSGQITNGSISGASVSFDFGNTNWRHTGTVVVGSGSAAAMQGSAAGTMNLGAPWGTITFTGNTWSAAR